MSEISLKGTDKCNLKASSSCSTLSLMFSGYT